MARLYDGESKTSYSRNFSCDQQEVGLGVFPTIKRRKRRAIAATKEAYNRTRRVGVGGRHRSSYRYKTITS